MTDKVKGYCVKCRCTSTIGGATLKTAANGRKMMCGTCTKCGTKMTKFVKDEEKAPKGE